ncbi:MAG TPA: sugar phosphate isomerase/epimerase [Candidatus Brocadiia bacterium]|nr:sugar phosphate isomerase/epimerase [Candidatus Brocadiia bacterium]
MAGSNTSRRDLLRRALSVCGGAASAQVASGIAGASRAFAQETGTDKPQKKIPVAVQLYSVRDDCSKDLPATLKAIAAMGYEGVEFAGYYMRGSSQLRKMLDDLGLKVAGTHTGLGTIMGDALKQTIEFNKNIGNKFLIVPGLPSKNTESRKSWQETAKLFNEISAKAIEQGMRVGYHNHSIEFKAIDGELPWDTFFGGTNKEVVMQLDTGNAIHGGADPVSFLEKYPGRCATIHLKEASKTNDKAVLGEGDVNWQRVFELCETTGGTEWYIVEQESYAHPPLKCIEMCLQNIRKMGR